MVNVNVVVLAGRLTADPEAGSLANGDTPILLRVMADTSGKRELPLPVRLPDEAGAVYRKAALKLTKGDQVLVRGYLVRRFTRGNGGARSITEVVAHEVKKLDDVTP